MGKSLKMSSRPLELGVVGVVGVVGGVDGTLNNFRLSGPFFSWLLVLFFMLVDDALTTQPLCSFEIALTSIADRTFSIDVRCSRGPWHRFFPSTRSSALLVLLTLLLFYFSTVTCSPCFGIARLKSIVRRSDSDTRSRYVDDL